MIVVAASVALAGAGTESGSANRTTGAGRLATVESNRYGYWEVAAGSFADSPLVGAGSGAFRVEWLRERTIAERVDDAHSLYLETAAELGLAGLACLALLFAGVAAGARRALRSERALAAGPTALTVAFAVHAGIDWDWEMPSVTLVAAVAAGALLAMGERAAEPGG